MAHKAVMCWQKYKLYLLKVTLLVILLSLVVAFFIQLTRKAHDVQSGENPNVQREKRKNKNMSPENQYRTKRMNVLFLMTDDMRTQIGPYMSKNSAFQSPRVSTPHLDRLATNSLVLTNAFVQFSLCGPSRSSMLTGRRPDATKVYYNTDYWREVAGNFTTIPQYFKQHGYTSLCFGKVFHSSSVIDDEYPLSWTRPCFKSQSNEFIHRKGAKGAIWRAVPERELQKNSLDDTIVVQKLQETLAELAPAARGGHSPFFVALGFNKPHLPFICPDKFIRPYPLEKRKHFLTNITWQTPMVRDGCSLTNTTRIDDYSSSLEEKALRYYRQAYFGCISYVDSLIGNILDTLDKLGLRESTVISFVADHGYHLGENGVFGKQTVLDASTRVPMVLSVPGRTDKGTKSQAIVEAVDLFPTITEAAGLGPIPGCPKNSSDTSLCTHGVSFLSLLEDPAQHKKQAAMSQVRPDTPVMQYSVRTNRYRYSQWARMVQEGGVIVRYELVKESKRFPVELYDHAHDVEETINRSNHADYAEIKHGLRDKLLEIWKTCN